MDYKKLAGPVDLWDMRRAWQIKFLKEQGLLPHHDFLDYGCGPLGGGIPIIEYLDTGKYTGVDCRPECIEAAKYELVNNLFTCKKPVLDCIALGDYDWIWMFAVAIHMSGEVLMQTIPDLCKKLKVGGQLLFTVNYGNRPNGEWQGFPVMFMSFDWYEGFVPEGFDIEEIGTIGEHGYNSNRPAQNAQVILQITREE